jgi:hypothetical protein
MASGRNNKLVGQIGEFLACAELGKRGLIATPFSGNVPHFDILIADENMQTLPIQVKASMSPSWPTQSTEWMDLSFDHTDQVQIYHGPKAISHPDLIYVNVFIQQDAKDRFFIFTKQQLQRAVIRDFSAWMIKNNWKRPKNWLSTDARYSLESIQEYENNWSLIEDRLR